MDSQLAFTLDGHPWSRDFRSRYHYLRGLLAQPKTGSNEHDQALEKFHVPIEDALSTMASRESPYTLVNTLKIWMKNPRQPLALQQWENSNVHFDVFVIEKELMEDFDSWDCSALETVFCSLCTILLSKTPDISQYIFSTLQLFSQIVFKFYVRQCTKPFASNLVQIVNRMFDSFHLKVFLLDELLPMVILSPGHRQCTFIMNVINKCSSADRIKLLRTLCGPQSLWPVESFPIVQALLNKDEDNTPWNSEAYILVSEAFRTQIQLNPAFNDSPQFASLLMYFIRQHGPLFSDIRLWVALMHVAELHSSFLRTPLLNLINSIQPVQEE